MSPIFRVKKDLESLLLTLLITVVFNFDRAARLKGERVWAFMMASSGMKIPLRHSGVWAFSTELHFSLPRYLQIGFTDGSGVHAEGQTDIECNAGGCVVAGNLAHPGIFS